MNNKAIIYLLAFTVISFSACKKEDGTKGETGEQGIPGINGSSILSGTGVPVSSLGKDGDYYLDNNTTIFYGPKTSSSWSTSVNLKGNTGDKGGNGSQGQAGSNGSTILNGIIPPVMAVGKIGDYYINTATADFYGPKTAANWGAAISLKGPKGDNGASNIKMIFYKNVNFQSIIPDGQNYPYTGWDVESRITPDGYTNYSENGLVLVYLRNPSETDGGWNLTIESPEDVNGWIYIQSANKKENILIWGNMRDNDASGSTVKTYGFDVKVVMIPISIISTMSANRIDTRNVRAVENFLKIN